MPVQKEAEARVKLTMCPNEAAGKEWRGLSGSPDKVCSARGNDRQGCRGLLSQTAPMTPINQNHLISISLASALAIVVILQGTSTTSQHRL